MPILDTQQNKDNQIKVLVTGATGAVGPALLHALLQAGYAVRVLARATSDITSLPSSMEIMRGDITDRQAVEKAVANCQFVFHLAAKLHLNSPDEALRQAYHQTNVGGTHNIVTAAQKAGVEHVVIFSSISVYGASRKGELLDESSPLNGKSLYAQTKIEAERVALSAENTQGQPLCTILRLAAVYGPHMKGNYVTLLKAIKKGVFLPIGDGSNRRTIVYDTDVAQAALCTINTPKARGMIFNITDGKVYRFHTILSSMYSALSKKPPKLHLPIMPIQIGVRGLDKILQIIGRQPTNGLDLLEKLLEDVAVSGRKAELYLNFKPQVGLEAGWEKIVTTNLK